MHFVQHEITKPIEDSVFEDMCANVYGHVYGDPTPKSNGRRGQAQAGIDIFVTSTEGRIGIQCKRYQDGKLKLKHIKDETREAEEGQSPIVRLIVATTAANDAVLLREVQEFSDARVADGKFPVGVEFWQEICRHVRSHAKLQLDYAPNSPGGAFEQQRQSNEQLLAAFATLSSKIESGVGAAVPAARSDSLNKFISRQLDHVTDLLKAFKYEDAQQEVSRLGSDLENFDEHQKARWYLQRGLCAWHLNSGSAAAEDFFKAFELYSGDDRIAAARVRGLLLTERAREAVEEGARLIERFPQSVHLWIAHANARVMAGIRLKAADIPEQFRQNADALQLVSMALHDGGSTGEALTLSQQALQMPDSGFFVRMAAMSIALQAATADPVRAIHRLLDPDVSVALHKCAESFQPWGPKLLDLQVGRSMEEGACNLAYTLLVTGQKQQALELVEQARRQGHATPRLVRVELEVLRDLRERDRFLKLASSSVDILEDEALLLAAEVAANLGREELVLRLGAKYRGRHPEGGEHADSMRALDWVSRWKAGARESVLKEVESAQLGTEGSIELILAGARMLREGGNNEQASLALERAVGLLTPTSHRVDRLTVADLLFEFGEFGRAAVLYKDFAVPGRVSDIHTRLLECYLRDGQTRKAKGLIESFPPDWTENDVARGLAIRLGQDVGDWTFLEPLADIQRARYPTRASSWLFALVVLMRAGKMHGFHELLKLLPNELEGELEQKAQLARMEIHYGDPADGQNRLYRLYRENLDDAEAAAQYLVGTVAATAPLPNMEDTLERVGPGASVVLVNEDGGQIAVSLDPPGMPTLAARGEFVGADSPDAHPLLGTACGDTIALPGSMGPPRQLTVRRISSAYRRLLQVAHECIARSLKAPKYVRQMSIRTTEHGADFSEVQAMLQQQTQHAKLAFEGYAKHPVTVAILAKLLGVNVIDLVVGWPTIDAPPLYTCRGTVDELKEADQLLSRQDASYVVDAVTLAELVNLDCENALGALPKVFATTETRDALRSRLEEALRDKSSGRAVDADGELGYVPDSDVAKARRVAFFERMVKALDDFCEVVPAYGPESLPDDFRKYRDVLESEEYSVLLLAAEKKATVFTVDERLGNLGRVGLSLARVWPHAVIAAANGKEKISDSQASQAALKMLVWNRSFTPLNAQNLVDLCHFGGPFMQAGLQKFKQYLSSPTSDFTSIFNVALEFLAVIPTRAIALNAYGELVKHICEASLRHPACDAQQAVINLVDLLSDVVQRSEGALSLAGPLRPVREHRLQIRGEFLTNAIRKGVEYASQKERTRRVRLKVLKCTRRPTISLDTSDENVSIEGKEQMGASSPMEGIPPAGLHR